MAHSRTRPSRSEAEAAVRTLIEWAGDDPDREGLLDTPGRVVRAYEELFSGYGSDPREYLERTFEEVAGYDELVVLRDIRVVSFCELPQLPLCRYQSNLFGQLSRSALLVVLFLQFLFVRKEG